MSRLWWPFIITACVYSWYKVYELYLIAKRDELDFSRLDLDRED